MPRFWTIVGPAHWLSWALGAVAVEAHLGHLRLPRWASRFWVFLLITAAAVAVHPPKTAGYTVPGALIVDDLLFGLAFFVLVNWACATERAGGFAGGRLMRWTAALGLGSYAVYLTHLPLMVAAKQLALRLDLGLGGVLLARMAIALLGGWVFYRVVERPFVRLSRGVRG